MNEGMNNGRREEMGMENKRKIERQNVPVVN
jgi:hypothetical protein